MDFALDAQQQMLQDSAQRFFSARHPLSRARQALTWSDDSQRGLWHDMAGMGWLGLLASEQHGGLELGMCEAFLVAEAAGRQLLNLPFAASAVLLPLLHRASVQPPAELSVWIEEVVAGRAAINVTFDGALFMDHDQQCSHQLLVHGLREDATNTQWARWPTDTVPATRIPEEPAGLDPTVRCARMSGTAAGPGLAWDVLHIPPEERAFVLASYRMARVGELLGAASASLDQACGYAREREQFGKPIGSYQAIKHHLANDWMALDNARLAAWYAAAALDSRLPDWSFACAAAEVTAIEGALRVARDAIQIHGGLGFTWEHDAHLYLKRVHHVSAMLGGTHAAFNTLEQAM